MGSATHHSPASATSERARDVGVRPLDPCEPACAGQPGAPRRHGPGRRGRPTARLRPRHREPHVPAQHAGLLRDPRVPDPVRPGLAPEPPGVALVRDLLPAHPARKRHCPAPGAVAGSGGGDRRVGAAAGGRDPTRAARSTGGTTAQTSRMPELSAPTCPSGTSFRQFHRPTGRRPGRHRSDRSDCDPAGRRGGRDAAAPLREATATEPSVDPPHPKE